MKLYEGTLMHKCYRGFRLLEHKPYNAKAVWKHMYWDSIDYSNECRAEIFLGGIRVCRINAHQRHTSMFVTSQSWAAQVFSKEDMNRKIKLAVHDWREILLGESEE